MGPFRSWPMFFAVAFLLIVGAVLRGPSKRDAITAQLIRTANTLGLEHSLVEVSISNTTTLLQSCTVWTELSADGVHWTRDLSQRTETGGLIAQDFTLQGHGTRPVHLLLPSHGKHHRITVRHYALYQNEGGFMKWRYWRMMARGWPGLQFPPRKLQIEIPKAPYEKNGTDALR